MRTAPCKDCAERHPYCFSECERYKEYDEERKAMRKAMRKARRLENEWSIAHENAAIKALWRKKQREKRR